MIYWIFLFFALGISCQYLFPSLDPCAVYIGIGLLFSLIIFTNLFLPICKKNFQKNVLPFSTSLLFLFIFTLGYFDGNLKDPRSRANYYGKGNPKFFIFEVSELPDSSLTGYHFTAEVLFSGISFKGLHPSSGPIQINLKSFHGFLSPGQIFYGKAQIGKIEGNIHPAFFNYALFKGLHQIYFQTNINAENVHFISRPPEKYAFLLPLVIQYQSNNLIKNNLKDSISAGFLSALILGLRSHIPDSLNKTYIKTGVVHILSISGMHIAVIYGLFLFLFKPLIKLGKQAELISLFCLMVLLWFYAFITGSSSPVLRSVWMLSMVLMGRFSRRRVDSQQVLVCSAFIQLLISPDSLFDVSFQLSYLAIFGLIIFYEPIQRLFPTENKILKAGFGMIFSSIAAQLMTLPFIFFYFHQYAVYFLLGNLWVIPLSTLVLYEGVLFLFLLVFHIPSSGLAQLIIFSIRALNGGLEKIASLPHSQIEGIYLNFFEVFIYTLLLFLLLGLFLEFKIQFIWILAFLGLALYFERIYQTNTLRNQRILFLEKLGKTYFCFLASGGKWILFFSRAQCP